MTRRKKYLPFLSFHSKNVYLKMFSTQFNREVYDHLIPEDQNELLSSPWYQFNF